ncbi:MAG: FkbM family methyltransferase [Anaeromyxobacteraceae bacterium]
MSADVASPPVVPEEMWGRVFDLDTKQLVELEDVLVYALPDDYIGRSIIAARSYEHHVTAVFRAIVRPGATVLDVGANHGVFTLLGARRVGPAGKVIAVEPNPQNQALVRASVAVNGFRNVTLHPCAASDRAGRLKFVTVGTNGGVVNERAAAAPSTDGRPTYCYEVDAVVLDEVLRDEPRIDVVKVDVEAHEPMVFRGMRGLVRRHRPLILTEFHPWALERNNDEPPRTYLDQLAADGYRFAVIRFEGPLEFAADVDDVLARWARIAKDDPLLHVDLLAYPTPRA